VDCGWRAGLEPTQGMIPLAMNEKTRRACAGRVF